MGYRSEVALALKNETFKQMIHTMSDEVAPEILLGAKRIFAEGWVLIKWDSVKWYDSYEDVRAVVSFMDKLDSEDKESEYCFLRIGEEWDDTEERGDGDSPFELSIHRVVCIEWNQPDNATSEPPEDLTSGV